MAVSLTPSQNTFRLPILPRNSTLQHIQECIQAIQATSLPSQEQEHFFLKATQKIQPIGMQKAWHIYFSLCINPSNATNTTLVFEDGTALVLSAYQRNLLIAHSGFFAALFTWEKNKETISVSMDRESLVWIIDLLSNTHSLQSYPIEDLIQVLPYLSYYDMDPTTDRILNHFTKEPDFTWEDFHKILTIKKKYGLNISKYLSGMANTLLENLPNEQVMPFLRKHGKLITYMQAREPMRGQFTQVWSFCPNLQNVDLYFRGIKTDEIKSMARNCPKLTEINLSSCSWVQDEHIEILATHASDLRSIHLSQCFKITDKSLELLAVSSPSIMHIDVSECHNITLTEIESLRKGFQNLISLNVSHNKNITHTFLEIFLESCPSLKELDVSSCPLITHTEIKSLQRKFPHLQIQGIGQRQPDPSSFVSRI